MSADNHRRRHLDPRLEAGHDERRRKPPDSLIVGRRLSDLPEDFVALGDFELAGFREPQTVYGLREEPGSA